MGRELRKVPADWEHPRRENGTYQPMYETYYGDAFNDWMKEHIQWQEGTHPELIRNPCLKKKYPFYTMYYGNPPRVEYYQTIKYTDDELTHIQLYETTSEGTPISPVFHKSNLDELCEWAENNATTFADFKATKEQWKKMLSSGLVYAAQGNTMFI